MSGVRIQEAASWRIDEIYRYTRERWGTAQADRYITGLFDAFERQGAWAPKTRAPSRAARDAPAPSAVPLSAA